MGFKSSSGQQLEAGWTEIFWVEPNVSLRSDFVSVRLLIHDMDSELARIYPWWFSMGFSPLLFMEVQLTLESDRVVSLSSSLPHLTQP
jgi:hypothetical protein